MSHTKMRTVDIVSTILGFGNNRWMQRAREPANPLFDRDYYARNNPDVVDGGVDLYDHYCYFGYRHGCKPNAYFDSGWYMAEYPDVAETGVNPLDHYLRIGANEGRNPSPAFSTWLYQMFYPDVRTSGMNPLLHFMTYGMAEGRRAPPICLVPALRTMRLACTDDIEVASLTSAEVFIRRLRDWSECLLAKAATERDA